MGTSDTFTGVTDFQDGRQHAVEILDEPLHVDGQRGRVDVALNAIFKLSESLRLVVMSDVDLRLLPRFLRMTLSMLRCAFGSARRVSRRAHGVACRS